MAVGGDTQSNQTSVQFEEVEVTAGERVLTSPTGPIQLKPGEAGRLIVLVPYTPERVAKIKTVVGRRWHHKEKYWTVPHTDGALAHLLALFAGEPVEVDPLLRPVRGPRRSEATARTGDPSSGGTKAESEATKPGRAGHAQEWGVASRLKQVHAHGSSDPQAP